MWKKIFILSGIVIVLLVAAFWGKINKSIAQAEAFYSKKVHQAVSEKLYAGFKKSSDKFNKQGPKMVSKTLRLDKTSAGPGARITYYYTFTNYTSHDLNRDKLRTNLQTQLNKVLCDNDKIKPSLKLGATYAYVYSSNDGVKLVQLEVNKKLCGM